MRASYRVAKVRGVEETPRPILREEGGEDSTPSGKEPPHLTLSRDTPSLYLLKESVQWPGGHFSLATWPFLLTAAAFREATPVPPHVPPPACGQRPPASR